VALAPPPEILPDVDEWPEHEILSSEYSTLGFYISGHPLDKYAGRLVELKAVDLSGIEGRRNNEEIVVAGIIVQLRAMRSRRGARWAILTLQDRTGVIEALVFPEAFQRIEPILKSATPLLVKGRVAVEDVGTRVIVSDARPLEQVTAERPPSQLRVRLELGTVDGGTLDRLRELFSSRPGRCRVTFDLVNDDGSAATLEASSAVKADPDLLARVREICGSDSVAVVQ
jgi:DNA polymerase-3 subunit alpha